MKYLEMKILKSFALFLRHPIFASIGALISGVACSFISDYNWTNIWATTQVDYLIVKFLAVILACPWLYVFLGGILTILSSYGSFKSTNELEEKIEELEGNLSDKSIKLANEESSVRNLNSLMNGYQESIQQLNDQIFDLQNKLAVGWLKQVFKNNGLDTNERVSLYFELNKEFTLLARYSVNPIFNEVIRQKFPLNQGVISKAWTEGEWVENSCPIYKPKDSAYKQYMADRYSFNLREIENFVMKSCWYVAVAISKAGDNLGVIVFESMIQNRKDETEIQDLIKYCRSEQSQLIHFIEESKALEIAKRIDSARNAGDTDRDILRSMGGDSHE